MQTYDFTRFSTDEIGDARGLCSDGKNHFFLEDGHNIYFLNEFGSVRTRITIESGSIIDISGLPDGGVVAAFISTNQFGVDCYAPSGERMWRTLLPELAYRDGSMTFLKVSGGESGVFAINTVQPNNLYHLDLETGEYKRNQTGDFKIRQHAMTSAGGDKSIASDLQIDDICCGIQQNSLFAIYVDPNWKRYLLLYQDKAFGHMMDVLPANTFEIAAIDGNHIMGLRNNAELDGYSLFLLRLPDTVSNN